MNVTEGWILRTLAECRVRQGDTVSVEIKAAQGGLPKNLPETICAMANMPEGGVILLGISETQDFEIVGVSNAAELEAGIVSQAQMSVEPIPTIDTRSFEIEGKLLVAAVVNPLPLLEKPATYKKVPFLRQSDGDYPMPASEQKMIEAAKLHSSPDEAYDQRAVPDSSYDDLDQELTNQTIKLLRQQVEQMGKTSDIRKSLRMVRLMKSSGELTLAGLYGLGEFPQGPYPSLAVTAAVHLPDGSKQGRNKNLQTFNGPIPELLRRSIQWVRENIGTVQRYQSDGNMRDEPELPMNAVREVIANALIHRDLGPNALDQGRAIDIRLSEKALVVTSPGGLKSLTVKQLESEEFTRVEVNQHLYRLARALRDSDGNRVIEGEGGGLRTVFNEFERVGLQTPRLIDTGVKFTALLWRVPEIVATKTSDVTHDKSDSLPQVTHGGEQDRNKHAGKLGKNTGAVYEALSSAENAVTIDQLTGQTELSLAQVRYALKPLIEERLVLMNGGQGKKLTTYEVSRP